MKNITHLKDYPSSACRLVLLYVVSSYRFTMSLTLSIPRELSYGIERNPAIIDDIPTIPDEYRFLFLILQKQG
jgi:hypothetical protein